MPRKIHLFVKDTDDSDFTLGDNPVKYNVFPARTAAYASPVSVIRATDHWFFRNIRKRRQKHTDIHFRLLLRPILPGVITYGEKVFLRPFRQNISGHHATSNGLSSPL